MFISMDFENVAWRSLIKAKQMLSLPFRFKQVTYCSTLLEHLLDELLLRPNS